MNAKFLLTILGCGSLLLSSNVASAQEVVYEETIVTESVTNCKDHYTGTWRDNWFIQLGAGEQAFFGDDFKDGGASKTEIHFTPIYNVGFGHWVNPSLAIRLSGYYGRIHNDANKYQKFSQAGADLDVMWDMTTTCCGTNTKRVFSFIPFIGLGAQYNWDFNYTYDIVTDYHKNKDQRKVNSWALPVSLGFQLRFRLCKAVDFFAEVRAKFAGDNSNLVTTGNPIDVGVSAIGGLSFNIRGRQFDRYNTCDYLAYVDEITGLNTKVNDLRGELDACASALAAANAQNAALASELNACKARKPEVVKEVTNTLQSVRYVFFRLGSSVITPDQRPNVEMIANYMKHNPESNVVIKGYASKDGNIDLNTRLANARAESVKNMLINTYKINANRIKAEGEGIGEMFSEESWNRVAICTLD